MHDLFAVANFLVFSFLTFPFYTLPEEFALLTSIWNVAASMAKSASTGGRGTVLWRISHVIYNKSKFIVVFIRRGGCWRLVQRDQQSRLQKRRSRSAQIFIPIFLEHLRLHRHRAVRCRSRRTIPASRFAVSTAEVFRRTGCYSRPGRHSSGGDL